MVPKLSRRKLWAALALPLLVGGVGVAYVVWPRGATPVTVADAVSRFRETAADAADGPDDVATSTSTAGDLGAEGAGSPADDGLATAEDPTVDTAPATVDAPPTTVVTTTPEPTTTTTVPAGPTRPAQGVYVHSTTGYEKVQLGLFSERRTFPAEVPMTVIHAEDRRCFTVRIDLIRQHRESTTYCGTDDGGLRLVDHRKDQSIGAMKPTATMSCSPDVLIAPDHGTARMSCRLKMTNGPMSQSAKLAGTAEVVGTEAIEVQGRSVPAIRVEVRHKVSGDMSGRWNETLWLAADSWLPLRIERDLDLSGFATFREQSTLAVTSTEPVS